MHTNVDVIATASQPLSGTVKAAHNDCKWFIAPPYEFMQLKIRKLPLPSFLQLLLEILLIGSISLALTSIGLYRILLIKWFPKQVAKMLERMESQL